MLNPIGPVDATRQAHLAAVIAQYEQQPPTLADALEAAGETHSALRQLAHLYCQAGPGTQPASHPEMVE